jgi:4-amino-4-deoxy-L-arabinose transferase-like glycosyltransferase
MKLSHITKPHWLACGAVLFQAVLWIILPVLMFGNLHSDTLEAAYWAQHLTWGYSKHPPLTTWLIYVFLKLPIPPIAALMVLSQTAICVTALFVWRTLRLYRDGAAAFGAVFLFLVSPIACFYATQFNHNTMLAPFYAAALFYGLRYLRATHARDAVFLGLVAGFGFLAKYEIVFALMTLLITAALIPSYRHVFSRGVSYIAVVIFCAVITPHIIWLAEHDFPSVGRAVGEKHIHTLAQFGFSAFNVIIGFVLMFLGMIFILPFDSKLFRALRRLADERVSDAHVLIISPLILLLLGSLVTWQVFKPLWALALTPSIVIGLSLLVDWSELRFMRGIDLAHVLKRLSLPVFVFFCYVSFLVMNDMPLAAYSARTENILTQARALWAQNNQAPLTCVAVNEQKFGPSVYMLSRGAIKIIHPDAPHFDEQSIIADCAQSGAIAFFDVNETQKFELLNQSCVGPRHDIYVEDVVGLSNSNWHFSMFYIAPLDTKAPPSCPEVLH